MVTISKPIVFKTCLGMDNLNNEYRLMPTEKGYYLRNCENVDINGTNEVVRRMGYVATSDVVDFSLDDQSSPGTPSQLPTYKVPMTTDTKWLHWNGRFYGTYQNVILFSDVNTQYRDKRVDRSIIALPTTAYLIGGVEDGIWIGDLHNIYFLDGNSPSTFKFVQRADYPIIRGSEQSFKGIPVGESSGGLKLSGNKLTTGGVNNRGIVITTPKGICILRNGGEFTNITEKYFKLGMNPVRAVSLIKQGDTNQYIVILK